jgi:hypothetical protein
LVLVVERDDFKIFGCSGSLVRLFSIGWCEEKIREFLGQGA